MTVLKRFENAKLQKIENFKFFSNLKPSLSMKVQKAISSPKFKKIRITEIFSKSKNSIFYIFFFKVEKVIWIESLNATIICPSY